MTLDSMSGILVLSSESLFLFHEKYYVFAAEWFSHVPSCQKKKKKKKICETDILILLSAVSFSFQADSSSLETVFSRTV